MSASPPDRQRSRDGGPAILVVDDDENIRLLVKRMLTMNGYRCETVASAGEARQCLPEGWDLVLCDLRMERETGMNLLGHVRSEYPELPVVIVSGVSDMTTATAALKLGADGYVTKPFQEHHLMIAVVNALRRGRLEAENAAHRARLERIVAERTSALAQAVERLERSEAQLRESTEITVRALARAIEGRDVETGQHIERMSRYAVLLARHCGLPEETCALIRLASPMHDVGKIGVPDGILFKPGKLSMGEYDVIKQHPELGYEILSKSEEPLMAMAASIARSHHERWDGSGYPHGLAGTQIPLEGRICAVADVFDAIVSRRVYKPALPLETALQMLSDGRGTQFDGDIVDILLERVDEVEAIQEQYPDM
ncbi:MAG: response regulator [Actinomycetota bacterium]|nr:response regulator [Actinomycetota bacterium]